MPIRYQARPAVMQDASTIFRLCARLHEESEIDLPPIDPAKAMHAIVHSIGEGLTAVLGADKRGQRVIVGGIGLMGSADWFTSQGSMRDLWVYCLPEYRSFLAARTLIRIGFAMAAKHDLQLRLGVFGGAETLGRKTILYQRLGLRPAGVMFIGA